MLQASNCWRKVLSRALPRELIQVLRLDSLYGQRPRKLSYSASKLGHAGKRCNVISSALILWLRRAPRPFFHSRCARGMHLEDALVASVLRRRAIVSLSRKRVASRHGLKAMGARLAPIASRHRESSLRVFCDRGGARRAVRNAPRWVGHRHIPTETVAVNTKHTSAGLCPVTHHDLNLVWIGPLHSDKPSARAPSRGVSRSMPQPRARPPPESSLRICLALGSRDGAEHAAREASP